MLGGSLLAGVLVISGGSLVLPWAMPASAASGTLYVSTSGSNTGNCQTSTSPCATISYAVSQAASGDTIQIASGTYQDIVEIPPMTLTIESQSGSVVVQGLSTTAQVGSVFALEDGANVTIKNLTISGGEGTVFSGVAYGDGVFISLGATATLDGDTVSNNTANRTGNTTGGGIYNAGTAVLSNDTISGNDSTNVGGGGIFTASGATTTLTDSTVSGNIGIDSGGGIYNAGLFTLTDDTITGNTAAFSELGTNAGGGIYNDAGTVHLDADTVANNTGVFGNQVATNTSTVTDLAGTIIAEPTGGGNLCDVVSGSTWNDDGYNLSQDSSCALSSATSQSNTNPSLGSLASNGGATQTMLPATGSPAIDKIPNPTSADGFSLCPGGDQRSVSRPQGTMCDVGSVEVQQTTVQITKVAPNKGPTAGGQTVTITGTNFTGATAVNFGTTHAASFTVVSATQITAKTPTLSPALVDVRVTTPSGTSAIVTADHYTFVAPPTVTLVSPSSGTHLGGTTVTITGTNLTGATSIKFGATPAASFTVVSGTKITAKTPAHPAGKIDVRVTTAGGRSAIVAGDKYTFT